MNTNLKNFGAISRFGARVALLALLAFSSVSRASVSVVNDLGDTVAGNEAVASHAYKAQDFTTTVGGDISSVILTLNFNNAAVTAGSSIGVYIYTASASGPGAIGTGTLLGTITASIAGNHQYTISGSGLLAAYSLTAGSDYAIVINEALSPTSDKVSWAYATSGSPNAGTSGSFLGAYNDDTANWTASVGNPPPSSQQRLMEVDVVPEVPMTGAFMGFGALAIVGVHTLRLSRKLSVAKAA